MTWLQEWWVQSQMDRRAMMYPDEDGQERVPAYPWLPDGTRVEIEGFPFPISFVAGAIGRRLPNLYNMDQLRRSVITALAGKPDTRTAYQRSRDDWAAYLAAKEKYLAKEEADRGRAARVEEAGPEAEGAEASAGSSAAPADAEPAG